MVLPGRRGATVGEPALASFVLLLLCASSLADQASLLLVGAKATQNSTRPVSKAVDFNSPNALYVSNSSTFRAAFTNVSINTIVIANDIDMDPLDWADFSAQEPYQLERNLTITSDPPEHILNYHYLQLKCVICPGCSVTYKRMYLAQVR